MLCPNFTNYAHLILLSRDLRWLVCGILDSPPNQTKSKEVLVMSNKDIESDIMDQTKSQKNKSLKQEIVRLRQQMMKIYQAWISGLPPSPFSIIDPTNTLSFLSQLQSQFPTIADAPQDASEFTLSQKHPNDSITRFIALQCKSTTLITPAIVSSSTAQPFTEAPTLAFRPMIVVPQSASESTFNTLDDHYYTPEPTSMLIGPPKFLTKKSDMIEEKEKCAYASNPHNYLQRDSSFQNPKNSIPLPQYPLNNAQLNAHPYFYPQWNIIVPEHRPRAQQIYQGTSKSKFHPRPEFAMKKKSKDNFTATGESYTSLFQILRQWGMITPIPGYTHDPHSKNFNPHVRCTYHSNIQGHSTEDYRILKRKIEKMIQEKLILVQNIVTSTVPQISSLACDTTQYVGSNDLIMGIQNLFVKGNISDSGGSSSHADMQIYG
ncbi:hypothetical protein P3L10_004474 [Capsicum annuum]